MAFYFHYTVESLAHVAASNPLDVTDDKPVLGSATLKFNDDADVGWHEVPPGRLGITTLKGGSDVQGQTEFYIPQNIVAVHTDRGQRVTFTFHGDSNARSSNS